MTPRISVIIPIYNVEPYLAQCLESLRAQTFADFEALCVDDGSTDGSRAIAEHMSKRDERFRVIAFDSNRGQSAARNAGLDAACGDYVLFLDSDDYYVPYCLERLNAKATEEDLDVLDFTAHTMYESPEIKKIRPEDYEHRPNIDGVLTGGQLFCRYTEQDQFYCSVCMRFIRRQVIEDNNLRFLEGIIHEDELFSPILLACAERAAFLNEPLYLRRMRQASSITTKRGLRNVVCMYLASQNLYAWTLEHADELDPALLDALSFRVSHLRYLVAGDACITTDTELARFAAALSPSARVDFNAIARFIPDTVRRFKEQALLEAKPPSIAQRIKSVPQVLREKLPLA